MYKPNPNGVYYHGTFGCNMGSILDKGLMVKAPRIWKNLSELDKVYLAEESHHSAWWVIQRLVEWYVYDQLELLVYSDIVDYYDDSSEISTSDLSEVPHIRDDIWIIQVDIPMKEKLGRGISNDYWYKGDIPNRYLNVYGYIDGKDVEGLVKRKIIRVFEGYSHGFKHDHVSRNATMTDILKYMNVINGLGECNWKGLTILKENSMISNLRQLRISNMSKMLEIPSMNFQSI